MSRSTTPPPSSARGRPRLRDRLGIPSFFRRLSRSPVPSVRSGTPPPVQSAPSAASLTPPDATSPPNTGSSVTPPADSSAISTVVPTDSVAPTIAVQDEPIEAPLAKMWRDAVADCQRKMGVDFLAPDAVHFGSKEAVVNYVTKREEEQKDELERSQWRRLRGRLVPLAQIIENLCAPVGDALSTTFPPGKAIFTAVGLIVSASIKTHEELDQIGDAFNEIKQHLQVVEVVVDSQCEDLLYGASVKLLAQLITILATILKTWRDGYLRLWLKNLVHSRPLSEALQDLHRLATQHHEAIAGVTYKKVTEMMSSIADRNASQASVNQLLRDVLQVACGVQAQSSLTKEEIVANRAILRHLESLFSRNTEDLQEIRAFAELDKIVQWLSCPDSSPKLSRLINDCAEGTGSWFLDGDVFTAFRERKTKSVLLSGKAGSGKSTLIAAAVQALQAYCAAFSPDSLVLVHLFDATDGSVARDIHSLLSALLYQIALKSPKCASTILATRKQAIESGYTTKADKEDLLMKLLHAVPSRIFIVVDALDESDEADVLRFLERLNELSSISLLASRRPLLSTISTFDNTISFDSTNTDDIGTVLDTAMSAGGALESIRDRDGVRQALLAGAEGNFRWTTLLIQDLSSIAGMPSKIWQRLTALPASLEALYKACLDAIAPADRADVRRLLLWLIRSVQPLSVNDFADLMSFHYTNDIPLYNVDLRPTPEAVINMVGLMLISVNGGTVQLAHASVRDYILKLTSDSPFFLYDNSDHALMARTCFGYLAAVDSKTSSIDTASHLTWSWAYYVHKAGRDLYSDLSKAMIPIISKVAAHHIGTPVLQRAIWTAVEVGHHQLVALLLDNGGVNIECTNSPGQTLLHRAAFGGHLGVAKLLLERGAHIDARTDYHDTPLMLAARKGAEDVVRLLLDQGADIEDCDEDGWTSLLQVACSGDRSTISLLLARGARIAARTKWQGTPLIVAARDNEEDVVRLLLDKGADIEDCDENGHTSLHHVASSGDRSTVSLLLERGADVNSISNAHHTPLHMAALNSNINIIGLLIDHGAALEARDTKGWTALYLVVYCCQESAIELLLDLGSDPRTRADDGTTLLDTVGRYRYATKDAERDARIRELLLRAGCAEETERVPLENVIQPEDAGEGS
ncbi:hypothetical protein EV714DRAFT_277800 [Schizophyllum commune]